MRSQGVRGEALAGGAWDLNQTDSETSHQTQTPLL